MNFKFRFVCVVPAAAAALLAACTNVQGVDRALTSRTCPANSILVCPVDRPTLTDPRDARRSGACRCALGL